MQKYLIEKMAIYLAKMSMHDLNLSVRHPSLLAVGAIYVSLKICEQLKKKDLSVSFRIRSEFLFLFTLFRTFLLPSNLLASGDDNIWGSVL